MNPTGKPGPAEQGRAGEPYETSAELKDILSPRAIKLKMVARTKEEALEELVDVLVRSGGVSDREAALSALAKREARASTAVGHGVAIPHAQDDTVQRLVVAMGVSKSGVDFGGGPGQAAGVVFLLLSRSSTPGPYIQALASIAELARSPTFVRRVAEAHNAAEVLDIIRTEE